MIYCDSDYEKYIRDKYFEYLNSLPPIQRFTEKFRLQLEEIPVHLTEKDEIFGWFGFDEKLEQRELRIFDDCIRDEKTQEIMYVPAQSGSTTYVDKSHTCVDYERIITEGLVSYEKQIDRELEQEPDSEYLLAMKRTLESVRNFSKRLSEKAARVASMAEGTEKEKYRSIKAAVDKVPYYPAENFLEAIQSIWIIHFLIPLAENGWCSVSLGIFDKYMYPYYKKALEDGMSREKMKKILYHFYKLLNSYSDGACLLNVGGENYNELSEFLIECQKEFSMPAPILGARIAKNTPFHIWDALIDEKLFAMGQPTFYSEEGCRKALVEKGISESEAANFTNNSCMGIGIAGQEVNSMWGCVFNVSAPLEAAMNEGCILNYETKIKVPEIKAITDIETLFAEFEKAVTYWIEQCVVAYELKVEWYEKREPDVFLSILTEDSIAKHCDRLRAARYHNVTVECMGMINVADGICAINQLVFEQKKYTIEELNRAIKCNFAGYENILEDMLKCPKYGRNEKGDKCAVRVAEIMQKVIRSHNHDNFYYSPSLHTLDSNVKYGKRWGAGYDGRRSGAPFAKNAGPSNEARSSEPTSMVLAAAKLPQYKFYGGQPIDVHFQENIVSKYKEKVAALIKTYLENGGLQFQVNSLSAAILRDAVTNPEQYEDLVVRIGGYSCYFNSMTKETKEEFIQRFEIEEG